jgi:CubicO group peptidase (beta-lactamase class C family)
VDPTSPPRLAWRLPHRGVICASLAAAACGSLPSADATYFPPRRGEWEKVTVAAAGYHASALSEAIAYVRGRRSSALIILHRGRILVEHHWPIDSDEGGASQRYRQMLLGRTSAGHAIEDVASVQKSVVSFLVGQALDTGALDLDAPVGRYLDQGWSNATPTQEARVTVRHLMSMSSGLTEGLTFKAGPGTEWKYNTTAYSRMIPLLERVFGQSIQEITEERLSRPIGMGDSRWVPRPWAEQRRATSKIGFASSARDLARFGLLILSDATWNGAPPSLSAETHKLLLSPSQEMNRSYGLLWWLNGQRGVKPAAGGEKRRGPPIRSAPDDMVAAFGGLGRKLYIVPSLELVVVRLGDGAGRAFDGNFWRRLMKAVPDAPLRGIVGER